MYVFPTLDAPWVLAIRVVATRATPAATIPVLLGDGSLPKGTGFLEKCFDGDLGPSTVPEIVDMCVGAPDRWLLEDFVGLLGPSTNTVGTVDVLGAAGGCADPVPLRARAFQGAMYDA